jgi:hypothetical protein
MNISLHLESDAKSLSIKKGSLVPLTLGNRGQVKRRVRPSPRAPPLSLSLPPPSPSSHSPPPLPKGFAQISLSPPQITLFFLPLFSWWRDTSVTAWQHARQRRQVGISGRYTYPYTAPYPNQKTEQ